MNFNTTELKLLNNYTIILYSIVHFTNTLNILVTNDFYSLISKTNTLYMYTHYVII